jgi:hypothetical protein
MWGLRLRQDSKLRDLLGALLAPVAAGLDVGWVAYWQRT